MKHAVRLVLTLAVFAVFSNAAYAVPVVFTTRAAFDAATAGSPRFTEDFQSFTTDTQFRTATVNVNGNFTLRQAGLDQLFRNQIDAPPLEFTDNNGTASISGFVDGTNTFFDLTFTNPVYAFGGDFFATTGGEGLVIDLFNPAGTLFATLPVNVATSGFFGFVNSSQAELISRIRFRAATDNGVLGSGEGFGLDNVVGVRPGGQTNPIPEPTTMFLLGTGLAGVAAKVRRRKTQK